MTSRHDTSPMERLIRRCLKNGIKTLSGQDSRPHSATAGHAQVVTYQNDHATFLALLQYDAAHLDPTFDQGQRPQEFAALVEKIAATMAL